MNQSMKDLKNPWARLYLVPQTEGSNMPEYITGRFIQETASHYVLDSVIEYDVETDEYVATQGMSFINRTYVWRCQILPYNPLEVLNQENDDFFEGGLG